MDRLPGATIPQSEEKNREKGEASQKFRYPYQGGWTMVTRLGTETLKATRSD